MRKNIYLYEDLSGTDIYYLEDILRILFFCQSWERFLSNIRSCYCPVLKIYDTKMSVR